MRLSLCSDTLLAKSHAGEDVFIPTLFWPNARAFMDDWDKPLGELLPKDVSHHGDELKHRLQTGLRAIVAHSSVICGLPASEATGEAFVGRLDAILSAVSAGQWLPASFYTPLWHLREWLRGRARPEGQAAISGPSDAEWSAYVAQIASGR
jgi:hypothetical protein